MKRILILWIAFLPFYLHAQVSENFSDGNFTTNPVWSGTTSNFIVNGAFQLQSNASTTSVSYLSTPSTAIKDGSWQCTVKINYTTSSSNYACFYLTSENTNLTNTNGYYVQIGNSDDEVSLYKQTGTSKTKIIDGVNSRVNANPVNVSVKVTRDAAGNWTLYSKIPTDADYVLEGTVLDTSFETSYYAGVLFSNTSTTGSDYYFDDIAITGDKYPDNTPPTVNSVAISGTNQLVVNFSEKIDFSNASFAVSGIGIPTVTTIADDAKSVTLTYATAFQPSTPYTLSANNIIDLSGNPLATTDYLFGVLEAPAATDIVLNEILFNSPTAAEEYVEIFNKTDKFLDASGIRITTKKTDGKLSTTSYSSIPSGTALLPKGYLALCKTPSVVKNYFGSPDTAKFIAMSSLPGLTNDGATIVLFRTVNTDTLRMDSLTYSPKWHYPLIKNDQGVALERINPYAATQSQSNWHSASSEVKYGTPGYKNSQYRLPETTSQEKSFWLENDVFTPDNDGNNDILILHYKMPDNGYMTNITIYDAVGQTVKNLVSSYLLATEGTISWDGSTDKGTAANVGVYVIYADVYNASTGATIRQKIPCVVSTR